MVPRQRVCVQHACVIPPVRKAREPHAVGRFRWVLQGSQDNTRRAPISARAAHRCWTGAMRTSGEFIYGGSSENFSSRDCLENSQVETCGACLVARNGRQKRFHDLLAAFSTTVLGSIPIFQTVSLGTWVNSVRCAQVSRERRNLNGCRRRFRRSTSAVSLSAG
jgi:hypothetical protein